MIATRWNGDLSGLGRELLHCDKSFDEIVRVAHGHTIDAAHRSIREELHAKRVMELAKKHSLSEEETRKEMRRGAIICTDDYEIGDIKNYGDWAEFEYDIRGTNVYFRPLEGSYPFSVTRAPGFRVLTEKVTQGKVQDEADRERNEEDEQGTLQEPFNFEDWAYEEWREREVFGREQDETR